MTAAYRTTLSKTRILDTQACASQKWIHTSDSNQTSQLHAIKRIHSGSNDDSNASDKGDNSHPINRIRNNVSWMMNNFRAPSLSVPDWRKYVQIETNFAESLKKSADKIYENVTLKRQHMKKMQMAKKLHSKESEINPSSGSDKKLDEFSSHIQDINESIVSFYDTSAVHNIHAKTVTHEASHDGVVAGSETKSERIDEAGLWKMFGAAFSLTAAPEVKQEQSKPVIRKDFVSKSSIDSRTKALVHNLKQASSNMSKLKRTEDLCNHLLQYPDTRTTAVKEKCLPTLLRLFKTKDRSLKAEVSKALSLVGYVHPPKGRGVRILSIDGGGTRGLVAIQTLKKLQEECKTDITNLFDYVCGVSTGSLLAALLFIMKVPISEVEERYIEFSRQMFTRNMVYGTGKLVWSHAFYDTATWEKILKLNVPEGLVLADVAKDITVPKWSAISCMMNVPKMKTFMFRTYNLPPGVYSQYPGNCKHKLWESVRASTAAPGVYDEFVLGDFIHQDGGFLANNPSAVAIHECKLLWPDESIQCVISLGNGRYEPNLEITPKLSSLKDKVTKVIDCATTTETVHSILQDLMPSSTYYRFNPYMSEDFRLDEIRPEGIVQMQHDATMYLRKNDFKVNCARDQLLLKRLPHQKALDKVKSMADSSVMADAELF